ncbi:MAG: hypothetical protein JSS04_11260 [Proteobacteria bacterium]|nr:hypothetical protein [Pseudomonadota bacterium]
MAPPSSQAYAPLWLKVLVVVMGLLIVVGFIVVASEIARRMSSASSGAAPSGAAFSVRIALPSGSQVVSVGPAGDRVAVHVKAADGRSSLYIVDPRSGALLGTVDFPPGAAR